MNQTKFHTICMALLAVSVMAGANEAFVYGMRFVENGNEAYRGGLNLRVEGITAASYLRLGGGLDWIDLWIDSESEKAGFEVGAETLSAFNELFRGTYLLRILRDSSETMYAFTIQDLSAEWLPALPELGSRPSQIPPQYRFEWNWDDRADLKVVEYRSEGNTVNNEQWLWSSDPGFDDLYRDVDFGTFRGVGIFRVIYGNQRTDWMIGWTLTSGDELFDGHPPAQYAGAGEGFTFEVIPEPSTVVLALVGVGGVRVALRPRGRRRWIL